jgi:ABC-type branched-subunit amino acid transport system substrate-binding protein
MWAEVSDAAKILKQMRTMGMKQPVFGPSRLCYPQMIEAAGAAAEGLVTTSAIDPTRSDSKWLQFRKDYQAKFHEDPDAYAAYGFDGISLLIAAVEKAGLNRGKIMDALRDHKGHTFEGVAGDAQFDYTLNNIAPITMARVEGGKFVYASPKPRSLTAENGEAGAH